MIWTVGESSCPFAVCCKGAWRELKLGRKAFGYINMGTYLLDLPCVLYCGDSCVLKGVVVVSPDN